MAPRDTIDIEVEEVPGRHALPESLRPLQCQALKRQLLWCVAASPSAQGVDVRLAPAGAHAPDAGLVVEELLPWGLLREHDADPDELVGRTLWFDPGARPPLPRLRLLPRRVAGARPVLLAEAPSPSAWGPRALEGPSGLRLAQAVGTTLAGLLATFETQNLLEEPGEPPHAALRRLEGGRLDGRFVVVVGSRASRILGGEVPDLARFGGTLVGVSNHPSGKNLHWNLPGARQVARDLLVDALLATRRDRAEGGAAELERAAVEARLGRWAGWQALADLGVAGHSPAAGHAWRPELAGRGVAWRRRWADGAAIVEPNGRGRWTATIDGREGLFRVSVLEGLEQGVALVERLAACAGLVEVAGKEVDRG